ncbi:MAG: hypothetical protein U1D97_02450 [Desulfuromonadales bacterium]|nr:hypothetical protein [Desulfuromonadales bacterium]
MKNSSLGRDWTGLRVGKARNWILFLFCTILTLACVACGNDDAQSRKIDYELQERCSVASTRWAKEHEEVLDFRPHYNKRLSACVLYATLAPIKTDGGNTNYFMVYDPNANKTLAQYTVRLGRKYEERERICIVGGKRFEGVTQDKWEGIVKDFMEK